MREKGIAQFIIIIGLAVGFLILILIAQAVQSSFSKPKPTPTPQPTVIPTPTPASSYQPIQLNFQLPKSPKDATELGKYEMGIVRYTKSNKSPLSYLMSKVLGSESQISKVLIHVINMSQTNTSISLLDTESKEEMTLVPSGANNISPVLIDDSRILYLSKNLQSATSEPYQVNILDLLSGKTISVEGLQVNFPPYVSPTGQKVAFANDKKITVLDTSTFSFKDYPVNLQYYFTLKDGTQELYKDGIPQLTWASPNVLIYSNKNSGSGKEDYLNNDYYELELEFGRSTQLTRSGFVKRNPQVLGNLLVFTKYLELREPKKWIASTVDLAHPGQEIDLNNVAYPLGEALANPDRTKLITASFNQNSATPSAVLYLTDLTTYKQQDLFPEIKATNNIVNPKFNKLTLLGWFADNELVFMASGPQLSDGDYIYKYNLYSKQLTPIFTPPKPTPSPTPSFTASPSTTATSSAN